MSGYVADVDIHNILFFSLCYFNFLTARTKLKLKMFLGVQEKGLGCREKPPRGTWILSPWK